MDELLIIIGKALVSSRKKSTFHILGQTCIQVIFLTEIQQLWQIKENQARHSDKICLTLVHVASGVQLLGTNIEISLKYKFPFVADWRKFDAALNSYWNNWQGYQLNVRGSIQFCTKYSIRTSIKRLASFMRAYTDKYGFKKCIKVEDSGEIHSSIGWFSQCQVPNTVKS